MTNTNPMGNLSAMLKNYLHRHCLSYFVLGLIVGLGESHIAFEIRKMDLGHLDSQKVHKQLIKDFIFLGEKTAILSKIFLFVALITFHMVVEVIKGLFL